MLEQKKCSYCHLCKDWTKHKLIDTKYFDGSYMRANILPISSNGPVVYVEHMEKANYGETGCNAWFKINYCPICGRDMTKEDDDDS